VAQGRSVLDLWLMVMCWTWLFEITLGGVFAGSRYSLGWYTARTFQMAATYFVLLLFLSETTALYANMARQSIQRRGARHARQIAMDAMAASIGHEIKQPLTAMITNASAGLRHLSNAEPDLIELHAILSDMVGEGTRIKNIIGGVRTMFRKSDHDRKLLNINRIIRDALATVELDLSLQRVIVETDLDHDLPPVLADSGQLHQVFVNLLANAAEAMAAIAGRASVLTVRSGMMAGSSDIAVTVADTGVGIADQDSRRIFEPFFSTKVSGSGVGLTVCQVIIEGHGGSLQVSANKPYGTIFRVSLPRGGDE
jgi:signal transduction histidine kinase